MKFTEIVNESYSKSQGYNKADAAINTLVNLLDPNSTLCKNISKEMGEGYKKDFKEMYEKIEDIYTIWSEIDMDISHQ